MTIVLVHSSDIHVDDDAGWAYNGLIGLRAVLNAARAQGANFVLLAGDTFDNHRVSAPVLREAAGLIIDSGLPVGLLPGNHDPILPDCLFQRSGLAGHPTVYVLGVTHNETIRFANHNLE